MSILYFIVLIGVLIFVHELGHFLFAKLFGVKVLQFSIGMGPSIVSFRKGETEYTVGWLPLGGYVKMLGFEMGEVEQIPEEDRDRALMMKPIWQRSIISLAGPVFNLILPVVIYFVATMMQTTTPAAVVGEVFAETPAAEVGLKAGDRVVAIGDEEITYWHEFSDLIGEAYGREIALTYVRDGERHTVDITPETKTSTDSLGLLTQTRGAVGVHLLPQAPTIGIPDPSSPAARAGLETFDRVTTIDGEHIERFDKIESKARMSQGEALDMLVLRRVPVDTSYARFYAQDVEELEARPQKIDGDYSLGVEPAEMYLAKVEPESPAAKAGLETGDKLLELEGRAYSNFRLLNDKIVNDVNKEIVKQQEDGVEEVEVSLDYDLAYLRDGERYTTSLTPEVIRFKGKGDQERYRIFLGWGHFIPIKRLDLHTVFPAPLAKRRESTQR